MNHHSTPVPSAPPDFLTLEEAALVLRLGRTAAYREARRYEASGGAAGIPVERFGKQFRVPRCKLEERLGGPLTWPIPTGVAAPPPAKPTSRKPAARRASPGDEPPRLFSV